MQQFHEVVHQINNKNWIVCRVINNIHSNSYQAHILGNKQGHHRVVILQKAGNQKFQSLNVIGKLGKLALSLIQSLIHSLLT